MNKLLLESTRSEQRSILSKKRQGLYQKIDQLNAELSSIGNKPVLSSEQARITTREIADLKAEITSCKKTLYGLARGTETSRRAGWGQLS